MLLSVVSHSLSRLVFVTISLSLNKKRRRLFLLLLTRVTRMSSFNHCIQQYTDIFLLFDSRNNVESGHISKCKDLEKKERERGWSELAQHKHRSGLSKKSIIDTTAFSHFSEAQGGSGQQSVYILDWSKIGQHTYLWLPWKICRKRSGQISLNLFYTVNNVII